MIFTTVKKRVEKEELFPNDAVMTLVDNKFSLNKKAMELFGFPMNAANTSRIANGFDENNNVILTNMDTKDMYTNNVTAKNDFSSQLLATRLSKQFKLDAILDNHFQLNLIEDDGTYKYAGVQLINAVNTPEQISFNGVEKELEELNGPLNFYPFVESTEEVASDIIETAHTDEIAQQGEVVEESPLVCAEVLPEPTAEVIIEVEPVLSDIEKPMVANKDMLDRIINTEPW